MHYVVTLPGGREIQVDLARRPGGGIAVRVDGRPVEIDLEPVARAEGRAGRGIHTTTTHSALAGGRVLDLTLDGRSPDFSVVGFGQRFEARVESARARRDAAQRHSVAAGALQVTSPMPGRVVKVLVRVGDAVSEGQPVVVVEAMKMENELATVRAGTVTAIRCEPGNAVEAGATLVEIE